MTALAEAVGLANIVDAGFDAKLDALDESTAPVADHVLVHGTIEYVFVENMTVSITDFRDNRRCEHEFKGPIYGRAADSRSAMCKLRHKIIRAKVASQFARANEYDVSRRGDAAMRIFQKRRELPPGGVKARVISSLHLNIDRILWQNVSTWHSILPLVLGRSNILIETKYKLGESALQLLDLRIR